MDWLNSFFAVPAPVAGATDLQAKGPISKEKLLLFFAKCVCKQLCP